MKKTNKLVTLSLLFGFVSVLPMSCVFAGGPNKNTSAQPPAPISSNNNPNPSADFNNSIQRIALPLSNPGQNQIYTNPTTFPPMLPIIKKKRQKLNIIISCNRGGVQLTSKGRDVKEMILTAICPYYGTSNWHTLSPYFDYALLALRLPPTCHDETRNINIFYNRMATYGISRVSQFIQTLIPLSVYNNVVPSNCYSAPQVPNTPPPTPLPPISELNCPFEIPPGFFNS